MNICTKIHRMDSSIFDARIFDSLVPYIQKLDSLGRVEITVPPHLALDFESIKAYFNEDATLFCERGKPSLIKGTLKDSSVTNYLMNKVRML
jgi:hypothetical protein